jgi:hypothetical protein
MPRITPNRAERARDERQLAVMAWLERQGIEVRFDENERPSIVTLTLERVRAFFAGLVS